MRLQTYQGVICQGRVMFLTHMQNCFKLLGQNLRKFWESFG